MAQPYKDGISNDGGLNRDTSIEQLPPGDYPDALDISFLGDGVSSSKSITPKIGNLFAYDRGSVTAQNKKYRLYIDLTASGTLSYQVTFYKTDTTSVLFTANFTNGSLFNADTAITNAAAAAGYAINIVNNGQYLLIEFAPMSGGVPTNYYDYFITDTGTDELENLYVYQEAIDLTLVGENHAIGSFDLLGDLFIWSTSQTNLPSTIDAQITQIAHGSSVTNVNITFGSAHGLNTGERILVTGVTGITGVNGYWIVIVISATQIQLAMSESSASIGFGIGGTITINPSGIGEIGVAQKVQVTQNWNYTRLLRSREWNFVTKKQVDTHIEQNFNRESIYWTDDYNVPRAMYYQGGYSQDGALTFNGGLYEYGSISSETQLTIGDTPITLSFTSQTQVGGAVTAGNKRYTVRLLTENLTATNWLELSNPVNVYTASINGDPTLIIGNISGTVTTKSNTFSVTNIPTELFRYIEFAVVEYFGLAVSGSILKRNVITGETMQLTHTGLETSLIPLDITEIQVIANSLKTAKNIRAIDNRLILSNLTSFVDVDLSEWTGAFRHELLVLDKPAVGNIIGNVTVNEYQQPENVFEAVGYTHNEQYRFGAYVEWKGGGRSSTFWVDDIRFDTNPTTPDGRRVAGLPNYAITSDVATPPQTIKIAYVRFSNLDPEFIVQGQPIKNLIEVVRFVRVDLTDNQKEVVATGVVVMGVSGQVLQGPFNAAEFVQEGVTSSNFDYPFTNYKRQAFNPYAGGVTTAQQTYPDSFTPQRKFGSFYSPDILYSNVSVNPQNYTIKILRQPQVYSSFFNGANKTSGLIVGVLRELGGYFPDTAYNDFTIVEGEKVYAGGVSNIGGVNYSKFFQDITGFLTVDGVLLPTVPRTWNNMNALVINTNADMNPTSSATDFGMYYAQLFINRPDKFGQLENSVYVPTGAFISAQNMFPTSTVDVFGGDTFTQKCFLKERYSVTSNTSPATAQMGMGSAFSFYSQNRVNAQMKYENGTISVYPVNTPGTTIQQKTSNWLETNDIEDYYYDFSYNIINQVIGYAAFDENAVQIFDMPTRIIWSDLKPQNSLVDKYRYFRALNFFDIDNSYGEISHHEVFNGELFALQLRKWWRLFFNTRGMLDVRNISDVLIGDASVMSRPGLTISNYGCSNKWAVVKGRSAGGNDVMYWIDIINRQIVRFGADGMVGESTVKGLLSFTAGDLTWCIANDTPADGEGMHGWWHQRFHEAIFVVRAKRGAKARLSNSDPITTPQAWASTTTYAAGNVVYYELGTPTTFNQTGEFYISLQGGNLNNPPAVGAFWEVIPHTNKDYYNEYSLCFNELKNRFTCQYTPLPKIALQWQYSYLLPRPISTVSRDYEANRGDYSTWFTEGVSELTSEPYVDMVYNKDFRLSKMFYAYLVSCDTIPYKVEFRSSQHQSVSLTADFKAMMNEYGTAIKDDVTVVSPIGYSKIWGNWIICRFYFQNKTYNSINACVIKFNGIDPSYKK